MKLISAFTLLVLSASLVLNAVGLKEVSRTLLPGKSESYESRNFLHAHENRLFISRWDDNALFIYDIKRKDKPSLISQFTVPNSNIHDLWFCNHCVFTAHRGGGLNMIDVSQPGKPFLKQSVETNYTHRGLTSWKNHLFLGEHSASGHEGGFRIYDLSKGTLNQVGSYFDKLDGRDLVVTSDGKYLYQAAAYNIWPVEGICVYNVSDKTKPVRIQEGTIHGAYAIEMALSRDDRYLYISQVNGDGTSQASFEGLKIFSLANKEKPVLISEIPLKNDVRNIALHHERKILLARADKDGFSYIHGYDVSDPENPEEIFKYDISDCSDPKDGDLIAFNDYVYYIDKSNNTDQLVILAFDASR